MKAVEDMDITVVHTLLAHFYQLLILPREENGSGVSRIRFCPNKIQKIDCYIDICETEIWTADMICRVLRHFIVSTKSLHNISPMLDIFGKTWLGVWKYYLIVMRMGVATTVSMSQLKVDA